MPEKKTLTRARRAKARGKSPSTQAGEFVREEMHHIRRGKHGARSTKQAIAIGLSKARRAGVRTGAPARGEASESTRTRARRDLARGRQRRKKRPSAKRSAATRTALRREGRRAASRKSLSRQAKRAAPRAKRTRQRHTRVRKTS